MSMRPINAVIWNDPYSCRYRIGLIIDSDVKLSVYLHQKSQEMMLTLRKVEIVERLEIFSVFLVKRLVINRLT